MFALVRSSIAAAGHHAPGKNGRTGRAGITHTHTLHNATQKKGNSNRI
jgi:hypothetical protein